MPPRPTKTKTAVPNYFAIPPRVDATYRWEIDDMVSRFFQMPPGASLEQMTSRLLELAGVDDFTKGAAERAAGRMVTMVGQHNAQGWRQAASATSRGREIYEALRIEQRGPVGDVTRDLIARNALRIKSMPAEVALQATSYIAAEQMRGRRSADIAADLRKRLPEMKRSKIDLITRTEVSSSATALSEARSQALRIRFYLWDTSGDARVRRSHKAMNQVLVPWAEPPAPEALVGIRSTLGHYHAGKCPNCRCDPRPVIDLVGLTFPMRVYYGGRIQRMGKGQFAALAGL